MIDTGTAFRHFGTPKGSAGRQAVTDFFMVFDGEHAKNDWIRFLLRKDGRHKAGAALPLRWAHVPKDFTDPGAAWFGQVVTFSFIVLAKDAGFDVVSAGTTMINHAGDDVFIWRMDVPDDVVWLRRPQAPEPTGHERLEILDGFIERRKRNSVPFPALVRLKNMAARAWRYLRQSIIGREAWSG